MVNESVCHCGTCRKAYDNAKAAAAAMANNDCPVWMFMVASFMYQAAFDNLIRSTTATVGLPKAEKALLQLSEKLTGMYETFLADEARPKPADTNEPTDQDYDDIAKAMGVDPVDFRADYKLIKLVNGAYIGMRRAAIQ